MTTVLSIENLTLIGARLYDYASQITAALPDTAKDVRLAARVCDKLASLRFRVGEIAEMALNQDPGATARDLHEALADAEF
jgi:hypothetical protein